MKNINFTKMVASGNDFLIVDVIDSKLPTPNSKLNEFSKGICDRKFGAGADGLLFLEKSKKARFKMRVFNPDGSEPDMCGNGARCAALYFKSNNQSSKTKNVKFETKAGAVEAEVKDELVKLKMTDPRDIWINIDLNIGTQFYKVHYINTGVPHAIAVVNNVDTVNIKEAGKQIRFHKQFYPDGANADFMQVIDKKTIRMRTYERGVEGETLACGTGAVASALISFYLKLTSKNPVNVRTKGGEIVKVYFDCKEEKFSNVWLEGSARIVYKGEYLL